MIYLGINCISRQFFFFFIKYWENLRQNSKNISMAVNFTYIYYIKIYNLHDYVYQSPNVNFLMFFDNFFSNRWTWQKNYDLKRNKFVLLITNTHIKEMWKQIPMKEISNNLSS